MNSLVAWYNFQTEDVSTSLPEITGFSKSFGRCGMTQIAKPYVE
jgi:hypothetical protein